MQKTRSLFIAVLAGIWFLLLTISAQAITLGFNPNDQTVFLGDSVSVDLVISGLGDGITDSLSTFDLNIDFDSAILSFNRVEFGDPLLKDQLDLWNLGSYYRVAPEVGTVNLCELSFDNPDDLLSYQAPTFTLATLFFDTIAGGTSILSMDNIILGDAWGDSLGVDTILNDSIIVDPIPEPATMLLFGTGLLLLTSLRRKSGE